MASPREQYRLRINRVVDHIEAHLSDPLPLEALAKVAAFSPFHFHRIFLAMVGETPQRFIQRLRVEKAATDLRSRPHVSVTAVALEAGFSSSAAFARAFRSAFGITASQWRAGEDRKMRQTVRNEGKARESAIGHALGMNTKQSIPMDVKVETLPAQRVAYVRHTGPYEGDGELFGRLMGKVATWAGARDLFGPNTSMLCVYHDNPEVTDEEKLRISACVTIDDDVEVDGDVSEMRLQGGRYAIARFRIGGDQYAAAWKRLMHDWLPDSGFQPDDNACFERYLNDPRQDPESKHEIEICLPIKPL